MLPTTTSADRNFVFFFFLEISSMMLDLEASWTMLRNEIVGSRSARHSATMSAASNKVLVAVKAERVISKVALTWALTHVVRSSDCITLLAVYCSEKTGILRNLTRNSEFIVIFPAVQLNSIIKFHGFAPWFCLKFE